MGRKDNLEKAAKKAEKDKLVEERKKVYVCSSRICSE
jgi:hypothetical protein